MSDYPYTTDQSRADGSMPVYQSGRYYPITAAGGYLVQSGVTQLLRIITGTAGLSLAIYDGTSAGGTLVATITPAAGTQDLGVQCLAGLYITATGSGASTIIMR